MVKNLAPELDSNASLPGYMKFFTASCTHVFPRSDNESFLP